MGKADQFGVPKVKHCVLWEPEIKTDFSESDYVVSAERAIMAQVVSHEDKALCEAIIRYAIEQGYTDLFLIDEEFVKTAIKNEVRRRRGESLPEPNRKQGWISVDERLPTVEEQARGLVGIISGYNGKIKFENARVFLNYDYNYNEWYSQDYDIQNCKIECWMALPEPLKMKGE